MRNLRGIQAVMVGTVLVLAAEAAAPRELDAQSKQPLNGPANVRADVGWLGLYTPPLIEWVHSGERRGSECGKFAPTSKEWKQCRDGLIQPIEQTATLRTGPTREAPSAGTLVMTATPDEGFRVAYRPENGTTPIDFSPDLNNGNCENFHHAYQERRGDWFRLAHGPWPRDAWVDWNDLAGETGYWPLQREDIVEGAWGNIVILGVGSRFVRFRAEQERDMWMADGPQPPVAPFKERRVQISELFTSAGRMRLSPRYPCGC